MDETKIVFSFENTKITVKEMKKLLKEDNNIAFIWKNAILDLVLKFISGVKQ